MHLFEFKSWLATRSLSVSEETFVILVPETMDSDLAEGHRLQRFSALPEGFLTLSQD